NEFGGNCRRLVRRDVRRRQPRACDRVSQSRVERAAGGTGFIQIPGRRERQEGGARRHDMKAGPLPALRVRDPGRLGGSGRTERKDRTLFAAAAPATTSGGQNFLEQSSAGDAFEEQLERIERRLGE